MSLAKDSYPFTKFIFHYSSQIRTRRHINTLSPSPPRLHLLPDLRNHLINIPSRIARHAQKRMLLDLFRLRGVLVPLLQLSHQPWFRGRGEECHGCRGAEDGVEIDAGPD